MFLAIKELWKGETESALEYGLQKQYLVITTSTPQWHREGCSGDLSEGACRESGLCTSPARKVRNSQRLLPLFKTTGLEPKELGSNAQHTEHSRDWQLLFLNSEKPLPVTADYYGNSSNSVKPES